MNTALIIVDVQRDFCPGGALPAPGGDRILPALNAEIAHASTAGMPIYASRDWHPATTSHFKAFGGEWPPHCVQGTEGAAFHPELRLPPQTVVISKGMDPARPGYSAFDGETSGGRRLAADLRDRGVRRIYVMGIATEYCVKATALDGRREGFDVTVLTDAIAPIEARPGDAARALAEMAVAGVVLAKSLEPAEPTART